jgi:hypothetical protein
VVHTAWDQASVVGIIVGRCSEMHNALKKQQVCSLFLAIQQRMLTHIIKPFSYLSTVTTSANMAATPLTSKVMSCHCRPGHPSNMHTTWLELTNGGYAEATCKHHNLPFHFHPSEPLMITAGNPTLSRRAVFPSLSAFLPRNNPAFHCPSTCMIKMTGFHQVFQP